MKRAFKEFYVGEENEEELRLTTVDDVFNRAFDAGVTELELTRKEYRMLYVYGNANGLLTVSDKGIFVFGVKLIFPLAQD